MFCCVCGKEDVVTWRICGLASSVSELSCAPCGDWGLCGLSASSVSAGTCLCLQGVRLDYTNTVHGTPNHRAPARTPSDRATPPDTSITGRAPRDPAPHATPWLPKLATGKGCVQCARSSTHAADPRPPSARHANTSHPGAIYHAPQHLPTRRTRHGIRQHHIPCLTIATRLASSVQRPACTGSV